MKIYYYLFMFAFSMVTPECHGMLTDRSAPTHAQHSQRQREKTYEQKKMARRDSSTDSRYSGMLLDRIAPAHAQRYREQQALLRQTQKAFERKLARRNSATRQRSNSMYNPAAHADSNKKTRLHRLFACCTRNQQEHD